MSNLKVSIITVTYNSARTLEDTMQSVLAQTWPNIEYIIVDGDSSDGTQQIIKNHESEFKGRLRWVSEQDAGIYDAMNKGLGMATGDIVGILNSDDFFTSKDAIATIASHFTPDAAFVYGNAHFIHADNKHRRARKYSAELFRPWCLRFGFAPPHPTLYVRREALAQAGPYKTEYKISADFELMVRLFLIHRLPYRYVKADLVTIRLGGVSTNGIRSKIIGLDESVRACRENGIYTNRIMAAFKYLFKAVGYFG